VEGSQPLAVYTAALFGEAIIEPRVDDRRLASAADNLPGAIGVLALSGRVMIPPFASSDCGSTGAVLHCSPVRNAREAISV